MGQLENDLLTNKGGVYKRFVKRPMDFILSLLALILLSPLLLIVTVLVREKLGSPVIFKQQRPGLNEKTFTMYKFRTMTGEKDPEGKLLPDNERLTDFGRFLRKTSIDELPELFNVFKGEMSLIGPRPLLIEYLPLYNETQKHRHDVRPGITGWAQINGRNSITWEQKFSNDVWYVNNCSLWLDIKILFYTVLKVLKSEGISAKGEATMQSFKGKVVKGDKKT